MTLTQAIQEEQSLLGALLVAKAFNPALDIEKYLAQVAQWQQFCFSRINTDDNERTKLLQLVHLFYRELAFGVDEYAPLSSRHGLIDMVMDHHTGSPVTLAILFCNIGRSLGLNLREVILPGYCLIRCELGGARLMFFDALDGRQLSWRQLEQLYQQHSDEDSDMSLKDVAPAGCKALMIRLLNNLKAACFDEQRYQQALVATDLLVQLCPDDPYERRDRGFLYQQLDCHGVALADYRFFIRHCPKDPAAQLLKMQLWRYQTEPVVLH
ncbi:tetratricopeptide repeat protein [Aliiglaciecola sp. CAU 1673]|uniref:SirB1 family protein n=1 Tax=Aliiglaciecola sp. CAU 1673 TaxID=3032595 RepID=UPI0023DBE4EE|nr:tetratricopeptide repeat protein [Aliiglaciecola sp. CAU 1673]MDF2179393.1 tetratricopeptide repeat protein [Aliiglaciecola sp. CAU 1673]